MNRVSSVHWVTSLVATALAVTAFAPAAVLAGPNARGAVAQFIDLPDALSSDGTLRGDTNLSGPVNFAGWRLTSDLNAGEAPRFAPTRGQTQGATTTQAVTGSWSALGSNGAGDGPIQTGEVLAMAISGPNLYIGGNVVNIGGVPEADFIARWDGSAWHALGGSGGVSAINSHVAAIAISGSDVYVGGSFSNASGIGTADFIAKWNGSYWSALGSNFAGEGALNNSVSALMVLGTSVYVAGYFTDAATMAIADRLVVWNGASWAPFSSNAEDHPNAVIKTMVLHGDALYVGGSFQDLGGEPATDSIARWDWNDWSSVGDGLNSLVETIAVSSSGIMYAGGAFTDAGGQAPADFVARLDGSNWVPLGSNGAGNGAINSTVFAMAISGGNVVVGGQFSNAAGIPEADYVAAFDGTSWSALGSNGSGDGALNSSARSLGVSGSLIVGGQFTNAAGVATADRIAAFGPLASYKPDGRIRKGSGTFVGNNIYNTTGVNQTRTGSTTPGRVITFGISGQNDSNVADRISFAASGAVVSGYTVKYFNGSTDVTSAVNAGTFHSPVLAAGGAFLLTAKVTVKSTAANGSSVTRLVTLRSGADPTRLDVVKFVGKRS